MPFVKLDCGILNSTLWVERTQRDIFLTALLMATPAEFKGPQAQIEVSGFNETGFVAPAGWYGLVEAAGPGIVRRSLASDAEGMQALKKLGEPDLGSRSQAFDGRRLIRIDGGYIVLNYMDYLLKDYGAAERMRRFRARKAEQLRVTSSTLPVTVTYSDTDADAEADKNKNMGQQTGPCVPDIPQKEPVRAKSTDPAFERLRSLYPRRQGSQRWADALAHYRARLREGVNRQEIEDGVIRYAKYCQICELTGTVKVQQAATFLGTNRGYAEAWSAAQAHRSQFAVV